MLVKCSGRETPHLATNRSLISLNNVKVLNSVHYSSSKGTVLQMSLEKNGLCKCKCVLVCSFFFLNKKQPRSKRSLFILHLSSDRKSIIVIVTKTLWPGCWSQPRSFKASVTAVNHSPVGASELTGVKINKIWSKSNPESICLPMSPWYKCERCDLSHFLSSQDLPHWKTTFWGRREPGLWSTTTLHHPLTSVFLPGVPLQHDWDATVAHQTPNPGGTLKHKGFHLF